MFTRAIVRIPGENFDEGLTTAEQGRPDYDLVLAQHRAYCQALESCGLTVTVLGKDLDHPDSTFVEDTAVLTPGAAVFTRPGAASRAGEVERIRPALEPHFQRTYVIEAPGTVDGGDICEAGEVVFIGLSHRTNGEGARQLADCLAKEGLEARIVDIRLIPSILHLKSGLAALDGPTLVVIEELAEHAAFQDFRRLRVPAGENYAANCVQIRDRVFIPSGFPGLEGLLRDQGFAPLPLAMSEFQKMDGGLSCLSLRF